SSSPTSTSSRRRGRHGSTRSCRRTTTSAPTSDSSRSGTTPRPRPTSPPARASPTRSSSSSATGATTSGELAEQVLGDLFPQRGAQAERFLVDALVVAVEHRGVVLERQPLAEQPEAVADRARAAEEPVVSAADHHERHKRRSL